MTADQGPANAMSSRLRLRFVSGRYAVARLAPDEPFPDWASGPGFAALVRADDELTIVCDENRVPGSVQAQRGWVCLRTVGPFAFDTAGVVQALIAPLSTNGVGVFVVCTYDGEHVLIADHDRERATGLLEASGHSFVD